MMSRLINCVGTVFTERVFDVLVMLLVTMIAVFSQYQLIEDFVLKTLNSAEGSGTGELYILGGLVVAGIAGLVCYTCG